MKENIQVINRETRKRSLFKALSYRILGAVDTALVSWLVSGDFCLGLNMGAFDILKVVFYVIHEQLWEKISIEKHSQLREGNKKSLHLMKSTTWRLFSSALTFLIGYWMLQNTRQALLITLIEMITKFYLYYLHERLWHKTDFGIKQKELHKT